MKRMAVMALATTWALLLTPAHAQVPSAPNYTGMDHLARIVAGTPGMAGYTVGGIQDAVTLRTTGNVLVGAPNGLRIPVPVTAQATISKAALAGMAAKLVSGASIIGAAYTGYEVYNWIKNSGIKTCAPPDMFCKESGQTKPNGFNPDPATRSGDASPYFVQSGTQWYKWSAQKSTPHCGGSYPAGFTVSYAYFQTAQYTGHGIDPASCGYFVYGNQAVSGGPTAGGAYTQAELTTALGNLGGTNWDPTRSKTMYDAITNDNAKQKLLAPEEVKPKATPLTWEVSAPVSSTPTVTKTETVTNPDGSTSTRKTTETTTVTPVAPSPSTIGAPTQPDFKVGTTSVVTTTNNTTNVTTTESNSTTNYAPATEAPKALEVPTDYAREGTLQKVEQALNTDGAKEMPDQEKRVTDATKENEDKLKAIRDAIPTAQTGEDKDRFFSWVWTPPVGSCSAMPVAALSTGASVAFDICPTANNIRDVIGWLFALFGAIEIYSQIFKRND